jgi:hypothetical protein
VLGNPCHSTAQVLLMQPATHQHLSAANCTLGTPPHTPSNVHRHCHDTPALLDATPTGAGSAEEVAPATGLIGTMRSGAGDDHSAAPNLGELLSSITDRLAKLQAAGAEGHGDQGGEWVGVSLRCGMLADGSAALMSCTGCW